MGAKLVFRCATGCVIIEIHLRPFDFGFFVFDLSRCKTLNCVANVLMTEIFKSDCVPKFNSLVITGFITQQIMLFFI